MRTKLFAFFVSLPLAACFFPNLTDLTGGLGDAQVDSGTVDAGTNDALSSSDVTTGDGASQSDADASPRCGAKHGPSMVLVPQGYCIDSTEVTNSQYKEFVQNADINTQTGICAWNKTSPRGYKPDAYLWYDGYPNIVTTVRSRA